MDESLYTSQKDESRENIRPRKACFEDDIQMTVKRTVIQPLPITDFSDHAERRKTYVSPEAPDETFAETGIEQVDGYYKTVDKIAKPVIVNQPTPQPVSVSPVASPNPVTNNAPSTPVYVASEADVLARQQAMQNQQTAENANIQAQIDAQKAAVAEAQRLAALQEAQRLQAIEDQKAAEAERKRLADEAFYKAGVEAANKKDAEAAAKAIAEHEAALKDEEKLSELYVLQRSTGSTQSGNEIKTATTVEQALSEPVYTTSAAKAAEAAKEVVAAKQYTAEQQQAQIVAEKASVIIAQVSEALKRETNEENIKLLEQQKADAEAVKLAAEKVINGDDIFDKIARWVIKTMNL